MDVLDGERRVGEHAFEKPGEHEARGDRQMDAPATSAKRAADRQEEAVVGDAVGAAHVVGVSGRLGPGERLDDERRQVVEVERAEVPAAGTHHRDDGQPAHEPRELREHPAAAGPVDEARAEDRRRQIRADEERIRDPLGAAVDARAWQVDVLRAEHDHSPAGAPPARVDEGARPADVHPVGERRIETPGRGGRAQVNDGIRAVDRRHDAPLVGEVAEDDLDPPGSDNEGPTAEDAEAVARRREPRQERRADEAARSRDEHASHVPASSGPPGGAGPSAPWRSRPSGCPGSSP